MSSRPLFSIIIPTHNRASLLAKGIRSILAQDWEDWELLVIDDGSTDDTKAVVNGFADDRIRYFYKDHHERSRARNYGIELAQAPYLCFVDDDDYWLPEHLSSFQKVLANHSEDAKPPILRVHYWQERAGQRKITVRYDSSIHPVRFFAHHFCGVWSLCIPRAYLDQDRFPPQFRHWQDTHLILRLLARHPFRQLEASTYVYQIHNAMGSLKVYQEANVRDRIESNVAAIQDLFAHHADLLAPFLPPTTKDFLVCEKYLGHANGAVISGQYKLGWTLFQQSLKYHRGNWFYGAYVKLLLKIPLKLLTGYPKGPN